MSNDLDDVLNTEDSDEEEDDGEEDDDDDASPRDDEENHWLVRSVKRIRRSIGGIFGSPSSKLDDDLETHNSQKLHQKGVRKGRKGKKSKSAAQKLKMEERRRAKLEKKARKELPIASHPAIHKPVSRIRRQHVISHDDEDLADGSGSGSFDVTNRQCE